MVCSRGESLTHQINQMKIKSLSIALILCVSGTFSIAYAAVNNQSFNFTQENCHHYCNN